jgi:hypothetical protein
VAISEALSIIILMNNMPACGLAIYSLDTFAADLTLSFLIHEYNDHNYGLRLISYLTESNPLKLFAPRFQTQVTYDPNTPSWSEDWEKEKLQHMDKVPIILGSDKILHISHLTEAGRSYLTPIFSDYFDNMGLDLGCELALSF